MEIRIRDSGAVMMDREFRRLHMNTSLPAVLDATTLDALGADAVFEGPQATPTSVYEFSMRQGVEQRDGKWYSKYVLGPIFSDRREQDGTIVTAAEQEAKYRAGKLAERWAAVRTDRNQRLKDSDWTQLPDAPVDQAQWAAYRQALRDITNQADPFALTWPEQP